MIKLVSPASIVNSPFSIIKHDESWKLYIFDISAAGCSLIMCGSLVMFLQGICLVTVKSSGHSPKLHKVGISIWFWKVWGITTMVTLAVLPILVSILMISSKGRVECFTKSR